MLRDVDITEPHISGSRCNTEFRTNKSELSLHDTPLYRWSHITTVVDSGIVLFISYSIFTTLMEHTAVSPAIVPDHTCLPLISKDLLARRPKGEIETKSSERADRHKAYVRLLRR